MSGSPRTHRLIVVRHAKSGWDDPLLADHDRPLAPRGRRAAPVMAAWLTGLGHAPSLALVSSARRTQETWALMAPHFPDATLRVEPALYHSAPETILALLQGLDTEGPVAIVGHNPGLAELAMALVARPPRHPHFARFPTTATLVADFAAHSWAGVAPGAGKVVDFAVPRDFEDGERA
ncbi:MAG: histidine phosphatase family protein [Rhodobacteraceae bacterium]|nr:histidine phosphatase family protein [Paracoccaceae bacterium]